jgi:hypothetical protein
MFASCGSRDHFNDVNRESIRWAQEFPYRGGHVLVARLGDGWRLDLHGREVSSRSLVTAFEQARGRSCTDPEIEIVLAALDYNQHHNPAAPA